MLRAAPGRRARADKGFLPLVGSPIAREALARGLLVSGRPMSRAPARHASRTAGSTPVSGEISYRRPAGANADGLPTIRNFVPWKDMERKLAERLAERAAKGELTGELEEVRVPKTPTPGSEPPPPNSGVRPSVFEQDVHDVSYDVYSLAQLDARRQERPRVEPPPPEPSPWEQLQARKWPRQWEPKTVVTALAAAFAAFGILLAFAVVLAEASDDMKPIRPSSTSASEASKESAARVASSTIEDIDLALPPPTVTLELDDLDSVTPVPAPAATTPALRARAPKRPAAVRKKTAAEQAVASGAPAAAPKSYR